MITYAKWCDFARPRDTFGYAVPSIATALMGDVVHCAAGFGVLVQGSSGSTFGKESPGNLRR